MKSPLELTLVKLAESKKNLTQVCTQIINLKIIGGLAHNTEYVEKVAKCTPGCKRVEYSAKLHSTAPDAALADQWGLAIFFAKDKFPVKEQGGNSIGLLLLLSEDSPEFLPQIQIERGIS